MQKWIAALLNFFFAGLGYVVFYPPKRLFGIGWTLGAVGLTYVELSIQEPLPQLYWVMFGSVLLINTMFAIDGYRSVAALAKGAATA